MMLIVTTGKDKKIDNKITLAENMLSFEVTLSAFSNIIILTLSSFSDTTGFRLQ